MILNVVSPHQDDAALSISLALAEFARCNFSVRILNCFTVTQFAPLINKQQGTSNIRVNEDKKFAAEFQGKVKCIDLGHQDAPLRTGRGLRGIVMTEGSNAADDADIHKLARDIEQVVQSDALLFPLAADLHIDHHVAQVASLSLCAARPFGVYEDLPYAARMKEIDIRRKVEKMADQVGVTLHPVLLGRRRSLEFKRGCLSCYSSQVGERTILKVLSYSDRYQGAERLWVTEDIVEDFKSAGAHLEPDKSSE